MPRRHRRVGQRFLFFFVLLSFIYSFRLAILLHWVRISCSESVADMYIPGAHGSASDWISWLSVVPGGRVALVSG